MRERLSSQRGVSLTHRFAMACVLLGSSGGLSVSLTSEPHWLCPAARAARTASTSIDENVYYNFNPCKNRI